MRRSGKIGGLLTIALVLIVLIILMGFWRSWFTIESTESPADNRTRVTLEVDKGAIRDDREAAEATLKRGAAELEQEAGEIRREQ